MLQGRRRENGGVLVLHATERQTWTGIMVKQLHLLLSAWSSGRLRPLVKPLRVLPVVRPCFS